MVWYILLAYLLGSHYRGVWVAHILAVYISGFLEVGIEKFFYVMTVDKKSVITKGSTCIFAVIIPTFIACICCIAASTHPGNKYIIQFFIVTAGTAYYRFAYRVISRKFKNKN